ncbi:MAG TPA: RecQ family ATP-dependent DNA helicase [Thermoanaerobaculia bacterium]
MLPDLLERCLLLDLETGEDDQVLKIGAVFRDRTFERQGGFPLPEALAELDEMAAGADFILGHNLLGHDLPVLARQAPDLALLRKPVIDTLYLSPLAFPENPYHRLVKDYKLVRDAVNDPVADARLAAAVFRDQQESFARMEPERLAFYSFCLQSDVLTLLAGRPPMSSAEATAYLETTFASAACRHALRALSPHPLPPSPVTGRGGQGGEGLAYAAAWLRVAGGTSVLPPWVRLRYPETVRILDALRNRPCQDPACEWCRSTHDPEGQLRRFFGLESFRPAPAAADGGSLQRAIVEHGLQGLPLLAILATGGGKSLCYQLPALVSHLKRGLLTIVISPLQALMQDQVENLNRRTGIDCAAAINGLLTAPERGAVLERVRMGDVAILYVAPEQLRNRSFLETVQQREIGAWVFDEAHCLSKWGHDFRPDYLYAARFIRELAARQGVPVPPVAGYTATAKRDVQREILDHFARELGQELAVFEGTVEREELRFEVETVPPAAKMPRIAEILGEALAVDSGCAVVYFATRQGTERGALFLSQRGIPAAAFHAGLPRPEKKRVLEAFLAGAIPVVCATNAFGMGIDKEDVRLVLHADVPGSLEAYLQEAGRAGRDRLPARCVLLYDEADLEKQFKLSAAGRLSRRDVAQLLRGLRHLAQGAPPAPDTEIVLTSGELLRDEEIEADLDARGRDADIKVKTAIAWLERAGFVDRRENRTRVFQGRLRVGSLEEAERRMEGVRLSPRRRQQWLAILRALVNADPGEGLTADRLAELPNLQSRPGARVDLAGERVLRILHDMAEMGMIESGLQLTAWLQRRGPSGAPGAFRNLCTLERALIDALREAEPDAEDGEWRELSLRLLNQRLLDQGFESHPERLRRLLRGLVRDGKSVAGRQGSLDLAWRSRQHYRMRLLRSWQGLIDLAERRRAAGQAIVDALLARVPPDATGKVRVAFALEDLTDALRRDLALGAQVRDPVATVERTLLFLHEQGVLQLQHGLAVFRQAMTVRLLPEGKGRRYSQGDYAPLGQHYDERTFQIHVMGRYAELGAEGVRKALTLVADYFLLAKEAFVRRHFAGEEEMLRRATGQESFRRIVDDLANPAQNALVAAPADRNLLILAGPGSGKTRVVVHRCAYLLKVERVPARGILVLCFNRNAAQELRRRLRELAGADAHGVTVQTYHGLAMRLTGVSFATGKKAKEEIDFDRLLTDAVRLLQEPETPHPPGPPLPSPSLPPGEGGNWQQPALREGDRERLLAGYSHILVDEYQDINPPEYDLVSAIAGRTLRDPERKLAILAVGDDDQTIYDFTGANVEFIRRFQQDYEAEPHYLVESYRSTAHILACANRLIAHNRDRMKGDHPIRVNAARRDDPPGSRVEILDVDDAGTQAAAIAGQLLRLQETNSTLRWSDCAVLARTRKVLEPVRAVLESQGIPISWSVDRKSLPPLHRVREIAGFLEPLQAARNEPRRASHLEELRRQQAAGREDNPWWTLLRDLLADWREETGNAEILAAGAVEFLYESLAERSREPSFGDGVHLGTVHTAKGLEFRHVLLADGDWRPGHDEAERRLYYVGMTRARDTLHLLLRRDERNPHVPLVSGAEAAVLRRPSVTPPPAEIRDRRFEVLGLEDLYLSYAGFRSPQHPIHRHLARLEPGDTLQAIRLDPGAVALTVPCGQKVAMLSASARDRWSEAILGIEAVRVLALIERRSEDSDPAYRSRLACERWLVPVVEVAYRT